MELMKTLKNKSIRKMLLPVCLLLALGIFFFAISNVWLLVQTPKDLWEVPRDELEGKYVTVELPGIYLSYAYTEEYKNDRPTGRITSREYLIDANSEDYCGLLLDSEDLMNKGEALLEECDAYWNYETDEITKTFTVTGVMKKMPEDSLDFYHEAVDYDRLSSGEQEVFLPLYLVARDGGDTASSVVFALIAAGLFAAAVILMVKAASGKNQKQIMDKAKELSPASPDYVLSQVDQLYNNAPAVSGLRMNGSLILLEQGAKQFLYGAKDLCWAYQNVVQHKTNGINTGKSYQLILRMTDGTMKQVTMKEAQVQEQLQKIFALYPACVVGYSKELEAAYKNDRASFAGLAASQRAPRQEPAAQTGAEGPAM